MLPDAANELRWSGPGLIRAAPAARGWKEVVSEAPFAPFARSCIWHSCKWHNEPRIAPKVGAPRLVPILQDQ